MTITGAAKVDILRRSDPVQQIKEDASDPTCLYIGLTPSMRTGEDEERWQIRRVENKDGVTTTLFANDAKYNARWDQRTMLFPPCEGNQPVSGATDTNVVTTEAIFWIDLAAVNTEYSQALPPGTKRFLLKNVGNSNIQTAYTSGDTAINGKWYSIEPGTAHFEEELGIAKTVYVRNTTGIVGTERLQILSWS